MSDLAVPLIVALREFLLKIINEIKTEQAKYMNIINAFERASVLPPISLIPRDYRDPYILKTMAHYIENMEASTWKECVVAWKTDKHREESLAKQEELIAGQEEMITKQEKILRATEQTAKNSRLTAKATILTAYSTARSKKDVKAISKYFNS
jgi:hypothetical protein